MSNRPPIELAGLFYGDSPFQVPDGSLHIASRNVYLRARGRLASRRGLQRLFKGLRYRKILPFGGGYFLASVTVGDVLELVLPSGPVGSVGTVPEPTTGRVQGASAGGRFFVTGSEGPRVLDSPNSAAIRRMGGPIAPSIGNASTVVGTNWLEDQKRVAYRYVLARQTETGLQILGPPSGRVIVSNTAGGARDVQAEFVIPSGLDDTHFIQVYRSAQVDLTVQPDDDLQLVYERHITSSEATAGILSFTDVVPDALRGEYLYTSPNAGEGILQSNDQPPVGDTITLHKERLWLGVITTRPETFFRIIAVGGTGLNTDDKLVITGPATPLVYVADTDFTVVTGGSTSQNIEETALNLVHAINTDASNDHVWAEYVSGPDDVPGEIRLYAQNPEGLGFALFVDQNVAGGAWSSRTAYAPE
ncbi:MAG: hypothetical protein SFW67_28360, partial [Myxococcaceae bacterium]|nr:hypothetical protein [Myxococcaceae bacterium]